MPKPLADALGRYARTDGFWIVLLVLSLLGAEAVGARNAPAYNYDRWDNFEYYTPMIVAAHRALLSLELPTWNPHQHLGESFLSNPQMGTFYPPYTLSLVVVEALELDWKWLCGLIAIAHTAFGAVGSFLLLRHFGARQSLGFIGALGLASAGYLRSGSAVWIFLAPTFGWLPWTLLAAAHLLEGSRRWKHGLAFALGLVAQAYVGHPQILVYVWLAVGLFCLGYAFVANGTLRERVERLGGLALQALGAALLSAVTMLPIFVHTQYTGRKVAMTFENFVRSSVTPKGLLGLLLPVYEAVNGFIVKAPCSLMLHQAGWVVPALVLGTGLWLASERFRTPDRQLGRVAAVFAGVGTLLLLFALGRHGKVYGLTYAIPVWSSFRYPHKFLIVALPCLGIAAALHLELLARGAWLGARSRAAAACAFVLLGLWGFGVGWADVVHAPLVRAGLVSGIMLLALAPLVDRRPARAAMALAGVVSAASMVVVAQTFTPLLIDEPHVPDAELVAPRGPNRVLPVHTSSKHFDIVPRLLYQSATMLGIDSVTGCTTSMAPDWYVSWLPSNSLGILPDKVYRALLPSHFLRSLNVEYITAPKGKSPVRGWLERAGMKLEKSLAAVDLYRVPDPLPRAYFASSVLPFTRDAFRAGLWKNRADVRTAYVERADAPGASAPLPAGVLPSSDGTGQVLSSDWSRAERAAFEVDAPAGGFLVVSMSYDPNFHATVDGLGVPLWRTNALLQGVEVPSGHHRVVLRYENPAFARGLMLGGVGLALLVALAVWRWRRGRPRTRPA